MMRRKKELSSSSFLEDVLISLPIISDDQVGVAFLKAFDHRISFNT